MAKKAKKLSQRHQKRAEEKEQELQTTPVPEAEAQPGATEEAEQETETATPEEAQSGATEAEADQETETATEEEKGFWAKLGQRLSFSPIAKGINWTGSKMSKVIGLRHSWIFSFMLWVIAIAATLGLTTRNWKYGAMIVLIYLVSNITGYLVDKQNEGKAASIIGGCLTQIVMFIMFIAIIVIGIFTFNFVSSPKDTKEWLTNSPSGIVDTVQEQRARLNNNFTAEDVRDDYPDIPESWTGGCVLEFGHWMQDTPTHQSVSESSCPGFEDLYAEHSNK